MNCIKKFSNDNIDPDNFFEKLSFKSLLTEISVDNLKSSSNSDEEEYFEPIASDSIKNDEEEIYLINKKSIESLFSEGNSMKNNKKKHT